MRTTLFATLILAGAAFVAAAPTVNANQTCDPVLLIVCTGDSGNDEYAGCDGFWVDAWAYGLSYAQVCMGYDGVNRVWVCPLGGHVGSDTCIPLEA